MLKKAAKILRKIGIDPVRLYERMAKFSIYSSLAENGALPLVKQLKSIVPDISSQYSFQMGSFSDYMDLKIRSMHAFQCSLMLKAIKDIDKPSLTVVDIGDSAGTHMRYLHALASTQGKNIESISVNLDPHAIEKIKSKGLNAILCRAEELDMADKKIDLFTSFEMIEHLHNPSIFLYRLAKKTQGNRILVTLPYVKTSRVGLYSTRRIPDKPVFAENEHIFELSPIDWKHLFLHSGWKVIYENIYYQYPRRLPIITQILAYFWRKTDVEGFWGAILEKDLIYANLYQDWEK